MERPHLLVGPGVGQAGDRRRWSPGWPLMVDHLLWAVLLLVCGEGWPTLTGFGFSMCGCVWRECRSCVCCAGVVSGHLGCCASPVYHTATLWLTETWPTALLGGLPREGGVWEEAGVELLSGQWAPWSPVSRKQRGAWFEGSLWTWTEASGPLDGMFR